MITKSQVLLRAFSQAQNALKFTDASSEEDDSLLTHTFTASATASAVMDKSDAPVKSFSIQVTGTGAVPTSWTVLLEGSLDGTNFDTILTHNNTDVGNAKVLFSGSVMYPTLYFRVKCTALVLGSATNIVVKALGVK